LVGDLTPTLAVFQLYIVVCGEMRT